jgi:hypothetical protein
MEFVLQNPRGTNFKEFSKDFRSFEIKISEKFPVFENFQVFKKNFSNISGECLF